MSRLGLNTQGKVALWRPARTAEEDRPERGALVLLLGLLGNAILGAWWLDPAVGLLIVALAVNEGREAWPGEGCCVGDPLDATEPTDEPCPDDCCLSAMSLTQPALLVLALGVGMYLTFIGLLLLRGRRSDARALAGFIPDCVVLVRRLLRENGVSRPHGILLVALVGFIPVVGQLDDAILVAMTLRVVLRGAGSALVREHWPGPAASLRLMLRLAGQASP